MFRNIIVTSVSTIETSMYWPMPVRSFVSRATTMPRAALMPPALSATALPGIAGGPSWAPVRSMMPARPW